MKRILNIMLFSVIGCVAITERLYAQKETFDISTFTAPKGWIKKPGEAAVQFTKEDAAKGTYCMITLFKAVPATPNSKENFDLAWESLVKGMVTVASPPEMQDSTTENGWEVQSGYASFESEGNKGVVILVTSSGFGNMVNITIHTNTDVYEKNVTAFLESVSLDKPKTNSPEPTINNADNPSIIGTWGMGSSGTQKYDDYKNPTSVNNYGYSKAQYTLNSNGTYIFISKTFRMVFDKILLVKENGTYQINGNNITIQPKKSVIEAWSKKDGADKWGKLLTTQNRPLEKVTYQFTKHYFSGIQQWNLVLQATKPTQRDGPYSGNTTFSNAWYYAPISLNNTAIELPGEQQMSTEGINKEPVQQISANGFAFTTTNFDDGWTSTVKEDWVLVTKGATRVLIHYPNKQADDYNPDLMGGLKNAWNILVAPKYSSASNFEFKPIYNWESIEFAEADAVEKTTGKAVHVVLFKKNYSGGNGKYVEFITANKKSFEQEFGPYRESVSGWEKMEKMASYNKFAVAASDLRGKWSNKFTGVTQYVNAVTGLDAGMTSHASVENFWLGPGNDYKWEVTVASGVVGNLKFQNAKSNGKFSMSGNWQVKFSDIEGKPRTYNAYFSCVKGLRILWLDDTAFAKVE